MPDAPTIELTPQRMFAIHVLVQRQLLRGGVITQDEFEERLKREAAKLGVDWLTHRWVNKFGEYDG